MWTYLANCLAWSGIGLLGGAALAQVGWDIRSLVRSLAHSGRHRDDHHHNHS